MQSFEKSHAHQRGAVHTGGMLAVAIHKVEEGQGGIEGAEGAGGSEDKDQCLAFAPTYVFHRHIVPLPERPDGIDRR